MMADHAEMTFTLDNQFFAALDGPEVQKGNLTVQLDVRRTSGLYILRFHTEGVIQIPCDRCLEDMDLPISTDDELRVKMADAYNDENEIIEIDENEGFLNIAWFLYEFIALNIPMKHVHEPGQCNEAMVDELRKHLCTSALDDEEDDDDYDVDSDGSFEPDDDDDDRPIDPRWNELKKILDNN